MGFAIKRTKENNLSLVALQDTATNTKVSVLPGFGALLHAFEIPVQGRPFNIIDNYSGQEDIDSTLSLSYKSSKLSPFVCRIEDGRYQMDEETYEFTEKFIDGNAIHGLLYNKPFNIVTEFADDHKAMVVLRHHYKGQDPGYPFEYICEVRYTLLPGHCLQVDTTVLNLDDLSIPIADGWHPYFQLGGLVDDYELQFSSDTMLEFDNRLIPTGGMVSEPSFLSPVRIGNRVFDNCFLLQVQEGIPCCVLTNPKNKLSVSFFTNSGYSYLQIYTPDHRKSIAIENLSSAPDCFNNGIGLGMLHARHSQTFTVLYKLHVG